MKQSYQHQHHYQDTRITPSPSNTTNITNTSLQLFEHPAFGKVRVVEGHDGEPWFVAKDVATVLGYKEVHRAIAQHCKGVSVSHTPSAGGMQAMKIIPERDVYRLVMRSKLPTAEQFEDWVVGEVLPSIRKHGSYNIHAHDAQPTSPFDAQIPKTLPEALMAYAQSLQEVEQLEAKIEQDKPKVRFAERVGSIKIGIPVGQYAKMLKQSGFETGEKRFFEILRNDGFLHKEGKQRNMPTQKAIALGVIHIKEVTTVNKNTGCIIPNTTPLITGKGQTFFAERYLRGVICS